MGIVEMNLTFWGGESVGWIVENSFDFVVNWVGESVGVDLRNVFWWGWVGV